MQNSFMSDECREKIWTKAGPEFGLYQVKIIIMVQVLCMLNPNCTAFRDLLIEILHYLNYIPSKADPNVDMRSESKLLDLNIMNRHWFMLKTRFSC